MDQKKNKKGEVRAESFFNPFYTLTSKGIKFLDKLIEGRLLLS